MASGWGCAGWRVVVGGRSRSRGQGWVRRVAGGGAAGVGDGTSIARSPPLPLSQPAGPSTPESLQNKHPLPVSPTPAPATDPARTPRSLPGERTPRPLGGVGENVNSEVAGEACRGVGGGGGAQIGKGREGRRANVRLTSLTVRASATRRGLVVRWRGCDSLKRGQVIYYSRPRTGGVIHNLSPN